ncbi:LIM and senescent cell antigen-like-containing domain protein 1 isoform X1 [Topomyia yanbarensis]|uniref:LIM and senescent cell antigen-like-containing domain protein 1 isoform X1 n=2 Tax=Topomyia yanbarensis TaxID=2498891 RepID=UPI00273C68E8|nr:LIM and senescent cell antigen-like-containing domain protein 1 isoform X1 [Topomyia yanbarensis]XP_058813707.1 LIM and senescent cell antigen-like-containing domain protein 1 isoform X1 [Topomyia yanbarensis]
MSELKLKPIEDSKLYKRRTTSRENLIQASTATASLEYPTSTGYANFHSLERHYIQSKQPPGERLYQNMPGPIRHVQYVNDMAYNNVNVDIASTNADATFGNRHDRSDTFREFREQTSTSSSTSNQYREGPSGYSASGNGVAVENIIRDLKSANLNMLNSSSGVQNTSTSGERYQNLPLASSTPTRKKMELKDPTGRSNVEVIGVSANMSLGTMMCTRCDEGFEPHERIVNSNGQLWHTQCFVCAQCFRQFQDGIFYEFEGRKYCEKDFHILFAPCCNKCNDFVIGRVIKAMAANWHPECFTCERCNIPLADSGFIRNQNRALCHDCNRKEKEVGLGKHMCNKCHGIIDDAPLRFRGEVYHGYHFNCTACGIELDSSAREVKNRTGYAANDMNELYCLRCHDRMGIPICGACRRPIEERVVTALGKHWHVEHFVCAKCEKPFLGHRHYEKRGMAYCETHYHQLFGNLCFVCNQVIAGDVFTALNKAWCVHHFSCSICDNKMDQKSKFYEYDEKPVCKKCYERFPAELRRRLRAAHENTLKKTVT